MICPIVTIETKNGPVEINESDYDPKVHKLHKKKTVALDTKLQKKQKKTK